MEDIDFCITPEHIQISFEIKEPEYLLAHLLLNNVLFVNTHWTKKDWPQEAQEGVVLLVICNDCFGPYADAESIQLNEIDTFYKLWQRDPIYGPLAWVMSKRKTPTWAHKKIDERMREKGWDIEALIRGELPVVGA